MLSPWSNQALCTLLAASSHLRSSRQSAAAALAERGSQRPVAAHSLTALASAVGRTLKDGTTLRRVIIFCKTERIRKRAVAVVNALARANNSKVLISGRRHFRETEPGCFEVWTALESKLANGRVRLVDAMAGHVIIQLLPIWLPKVRIDASNTHSLAGWFEENYLPYRRPEGTGRWGAMASPLLQDIEDATMMSKVDKAAKPPL